MQPNIKSCKECFDTKIQTPKCPYEIASKLFDSYKYFKEEYGEEIRILLEKAGQFTPAAQACRMKTNAMLEQQEMFRRMSGIDETNAQVKKLAERIDKFINGDGGKTKVTKETGWKVWRPDIKDEKVNDAVKLLKKKYPDIDTDKQVEITQNKNENATIKYKLTPEQNLRYN